MTLNRALRLGLTILVAGVLVSVASGFNLGPLGSAGSIWQRKSPIPAVPSTDSVPPSADEFSLMGVYHTQGRDIPSPRLAPAEPALIDLLIAAGMGIRRIDPMTAGHSVFGTAVVHRLSMTPDWVLVAATSFGPGLVPPLDDPTCRKFPDGNRVVLAGFTLALDRKSGYRFGSLHGSVIWTSDAAGWKRVTGVGAKEIVCSA